MIRRKWCAVLVAAVMGTGALSSQTAKYTELLNKAKAYEDKKEWCYALGYYYDAMVEDPANADEVLSRYTAIADAIKSGKPGPGDYNEFTLHDSWIPLLQNTEKYWTEFCPEYFMFDNIEKGPVDFQTRTARYFVSISSHASAKYSEIQGLIEAGYKNAYRPDWTDMPKNWPNRSVLSSAAGALQNGIALFINGDSVYPAWHYIKRQYYSESEYGLYDLKFSICDENGTELLKSGEYLEGMKSYSFDNVPADIMTIIDAGKVKPKLTAVNLKYGNYNNVDDDGGWGFVQHLPELSIEVEQNEKNIAQMSLAEIVRSYKKEKSLLVEPIVREQNKNNEVFVEGNEKIDSFYMWKTEVTQAQYQSVMGKNPSKFTGSKYPVEQVSWYDAVDYCNKRSEQEGLAPCYSGNEDLIQCDFTANGYRLPTEAEWVYAAEGGKNEQSFRYAGSESIKDVAWYGGNSDGTTHECATKKPNVLGIYDMTGNVWEWCWNGAGSERFLRGGSYDDDGDDCVVSNSGCCYMTFSIRYLGFRVVRSCSVK